eukprot:3281509-Amphidinium_carterae.1
MAVPLQVNLSPSIRPVWAYKARCQEVVRRASTIVDSSLPPHMTEPALNKQRTRLDRLCSPETRLRWDVDCTLIVELVH